MTQDNTTTMQRNQTDARASTKDLSDLLGPNVVRSNAGAEATDTADDRGMESVTTERPAAEEPAKKASDSDIVAKLANATEIRELLLRGVELGNDAIKVDPRIKELRRNKNGTIDMRGFAARLLLGTAAIRDKVEGGTQQNRIGKNDPLAAGLPKNADGSVDTRHTDGRLYKSLYQRTK